MLAVSICSMASTPPAKSPATTRLDGCATVLVNRDMRRFDCPVTIESCAVELSVARIIPLAQTAVGMRGEVVGVLGRGAHEHLIDVELEQQMVYLGQFDETTQRARGNGSFHSRGEAGNAADCG
jgi:hypothetical protein